MMIGELKRLKQQQQQKSQETDRAMWQNLSQLSCRNFFRSAANSTRLNSSAALWMWCTYLKKKKKKKEEEKRRSAKLVINAECVTWHSSNMYSRLDPYCADTV